MKDRKTSKVKQLTKVIREPKERPRSCNAMHGQEAVKQKEHRADALALGADEGRNKLR